MDLSKLPRLSNTPATPSSEASSPEGMAPDAAGPTSPSAAAGASSEVRPVNYANPTVCRSCGTPLRVGAAFCDRCGATVPRRGTPSLGFGAEAWISIALGVILLFFFGRPIDYWTTRSHPEKFTWTFQDKTGAPLSYPQSAFFLPDVAFVAFAATLVLEGLVMLVASRLPVSLLVTFVIIIGVVGFNIIAMAKAFPEIGFQALPALAIAFGVYLAIFQLGLYRSLRR